MTSIMNIYKGLEGRNSQFGGKWDVFLESTFFGHFECKFFISNTTFLYQLFCPVILIKKDFLIGQLEIAKKRQK